MSAEQSNATVDHFEEEPTSDNWLRRLDDHGDAHGYHKRLGNQHGALFTEDGETLLVSFELAEEIQDAGDPGLPFGLQVAGREGWSHLCLYAETQTWFRDEAVYAFFDDLIDEGFFDQFDEIVFYGAGAQAYAAAAFSIAAEDARLFLVRPQATLTPRLAPWDHRFPGSRRMDFTTRYGFAPAMAETASQIAVVYDPNIPEDANHAALFASDRTLLLPCPFIGEAPEVDLARLKVLIPALQAMGRGKFTADRFWALYRARRTHLPYLRRVLDHLERLERPYLTGLWTRAVIRRHPRPRFKRSLEEALASLEDEGRSLPPVPEVEDAQD